MEEKGPLLRHNSPCDGEGIGFTWDHVVSVRLTCIRAGISPGLIRMSIGFTGSMEQRWSQLERACGRVGLIQGLVVSKASL